jgi:putative NADPH-quinone reductase
MNTLVLNGSPRGKKGMTWWLLERFTQGMCDAGAKVETIQLSTKNIHHCVGCLECWFKTPGRCFHHDDMESVFEALTKAEALVLATPVYFDGMTGLMKNCMDRMVPLADPHFESREGHTRHLHAASAPKRVALVSPCGFPEMDNFNPLVEHVRAMCRNMDARYSGAVLRPAAPIIPFATIRHPFKMRSISKAVRQAGLEFIAGGKITDDTAEKASAEFSSRENYMKDVNRYFDRMLAKKK